MAQVVFTIEGGMRDVDFLRTRIEDAIEEVIDEATDDGSIDGDVDVSWELDG